MDAQSLQGLMFNRFNDYANNVALRCDGKDETYGSLLDSALRISALFQSLEKPPRTVGIVGQRNISVYKGILGSLFANCRYVPINTKYPEERKKQIILQAEVDCIIGEEENLSPILACLDQICRPLCMTPEEIPKNPAYIGRSKLDSMSPATVIHGNPQHICYTMFTSGSTGNPKGVAICQKNLIAWLENMDLLYPDNQGARSSQTYDLSFDLSVADLFFTWYTGGTLCVLNADELMLPVDYIRRENITNWSSVPTLAAFMFKMGVLEPNCFPSLKHSLFCGEPLPLHIAKAWQAAAPNSTVENLYGPTEATIWMSRYVFSQTDDAQSFRNGILPIGNPFPGHEMEIVGSDGNLLPASEEGEIVYKGPQISDGYMNDPEQSARQFVHFDWDKDNETWYRSGDLGFYNPKGYFECLGRIDGQVKLAGRRIELGEIESVLREFSETRDAVVVPLKDNNNTITGFAAFLTTYLTQDDELKIRQSSHSSLEAIFFPRVFFQVDEFPLTTSGKVDRKALEKLAGSA
jgi:amino acid adenylation domain-containing protein